MAILKKWGKWLGIAENLLLMLCLVVIFIILLMQVVSRKIFGNPLTWTEELARYLLIWITYFGVNFAIRNDCSVRINMAVKHLPVKAQLAIDIFVKAVILYCIIIYLPNSIAYYANQSRITSSLIKIPMNLVVLPLVAGFAISGLNLLLHIVQDILRIAKGEN